MSSIINLKAAIQTSLETGFSTILPNNTSLLTGEQEINICEAYSETSANVPVIAFDVVSVQPFTPDDPTNGCYTSTVIIYAITYNAVQTTYLTDKLTQFFTLPIPITNRNWFRNITTSCILNKYTQYVRRGNTKPRNNYKTDTYGEYIEVELIWCECNCEGEICDDELEIGCPLDEGSTEYDIDDDCC